MFEVPSFCTHTSSKSSKPLLNSHINSRLFKASPDFNQPLLQFVDGVNFHLVKTTLYRSPDLIVNWIEIWTVWRPQVWRNEVRCFSTQKLQSFMSAMCRCIVLLEDKILPWNTSNRWQQLLPKKNITIVCTVYFRTWIDEKQLRTAQFRHTNWNHNWLAKRVSCSKKSFGSNLFSWAYHGSIHTILLRIWRLHDSENLFISKPHQRNLVFWVTFKQLSRSD